MNYKSNVDLPKDMSEMSAKFYGTSNMVYDALATVYTQLFKMTGYLSITGCTGVDRTVTISGTRGVFVEVSKANFEQLQGLGSMLIIN